MGMGPMREERQVGQEEAEDAPWSSQERRQARWKKWPQGSRLATDRGS